MAQLTRLQIESTQYAAHQRRGITENLWIKTIECNYILTMRNFHWCIVFCPGYYGAFLTENSTALFSHCILKSAKFWVEIAHPYFYKKNWPIWVNFAVNWVTFLRLGRRRISHHGLVTETKKRISLLSITASTLYWKITMWMTTKQCRLPLLFSLMPICNFLIAFFALTATKLGRKINWACRVHFAF